MSSTTTRSGLYKPTGSEFVNVVTDLNNNWDKVDAYAMGFTACTNVTRPSVVWAGLCIFETNTGLTYISNGSSPASGSWVNIPNSSSATSLNLSGAATGSDLLNLALTGDAQERLIINADGRIEWGSGALTQDTNLYRSAANQLATDDTFTAANLKTAGTIDVTAAALVSTDSLSITVTGEAAKRFVVNGDGTVEWGGGVTSLDTNLYRSAANVLKTDDSLIVTGDLTVNGIGSTLFVTKGSNTARTSTTTLAADPTLLLAVGTAATYKFSAVLYVTSVASAAGDFSLGFSFPASSTINFGVQGLDTTLASGSQGVLQTLGRTTGTSPTTSVPFGASTTQTTIFVEGTLITTVTSGSLTVLWAQFASNVNATTLLSGSYLQIQRVA